MRVITIGRMKIGNVGDCIVIRLIAQIPPNTSDRIRSVLPQFNARRAEERHRKVAGEVDAPGVVPHPGGKCLDEIFPAVAVIKRAGSIEQRHRCIDRRLLPTIPGDAQPSAAERHCVLSRNRKRERPQHGRRAGEVSQSYYAVRRHSNLAVLLKHARFLPLRCILSLHDISSGAFDEV
jgi:hypothetical protein